MQNLIDKIDNIHSKKNVPKYQTAYGNINLDGREINHLYQNVQKNQRIIKNYETVFQMIEKINDNKSYFSLKRELDKNKTKKVKKKDFGKHFLNVNNYQEIISDPNDKQNDDEKFMFCLINHIENRIKPKKKNNLIFNNFHVNRNKKNLINNNNNNLKNLTTTNSFNNTFNNTFLSTTIGNEFQKSFSNKKNLDKKFLPILNNNNNEKNEPILLLPKTLNKGLYKIYKKIIQNEEKVEKVNNKINNEIRFSQTNYSFNNLDNYKKNRELNLIQKKMMRKKILEKKFNDNSLFDFPLTNKIIYKDLKKVDYFEKAKNKLVNVKIDEQKIKIKKKIEFFKMLERLKEEEEEKEKEEEKKKNNNINNIKTNNEENKQSD